MYFSAKKELAKEQANECNCGASGVQNSEKQSWLLKLGLIPSFGWH
jgi:hypothetical protein